MSKPQVNIGFENGNIGNVVTSPDGVCAIVSSAVANGSFVLNKHEVVYSLAEAEALGVIPTVAGNYELHKTIKEFYAEAGAGTELWIYGVAKTRTLDQIVTDSEAVLLASNRRVRFVICKYAPTTADAAITAGLRTGFPATCAAAQALAETYTTTKTQPVVFILEAYNFTGVAADLVGFSATNYNRVAVMIGDTETRTGTTTSKGAAVGVLAGRIAKNQVHVNVGRVKDGALKPLNFYVVDTPVEQVNVDAIYDKGFITLTTHVGKSGYYFVDDHLATAVDDDYHFLTRRRVVDKAFVLANTALTNFILDTVPVTNEGKIQTSYAKALEAEVERVIAQEMTAKGELSADVTNANSTGVEVIIDTTNNIVQDSTINGRIRVTPHGYGRFLEFTIGFNTGQ
jgi:hypothetical protein